MLYMFRFFGLTVCAAAVFIGCGGEKKHVLSYTSGQEICVTHQNIRLTFDSRLYGTVSFRSNEEWLSLIADRQKEYPLFPWQYVVSNGKPLAGISVDYQSIADTEISGEFGSGRLVSVGGVIADSVLAILLQIELYDAYPGTAIIQTRYTNRTTGKSIHLDSVVTCNYHLDARKVQPAAEPYEFLSFQGGSYWHGSNYTCIPITADFRQMNFMGWGPFSPDTPKNRLGDRRGTIPLIDVWQKRMGMALAHIEPQVKLVSLPVTTQNNGTVNIRIAETPDTILQPGMSWETVRTAVIVHALDYFEPLNTYSQLLTDQGIHIRHNSSPNLAYEPRWGTFGGYAWYWTKDDVYEILPLAKKFGIGVINLDAGWQRRCAIPGRVVAPREVLVANKHYLGGEWGNSGGIVPDYVPDRGRFPGGDQEFKKFVADIHKAGFGVEVWVQIMSAEPSSQIFKEHPDWFVRDRDGHMVASNRGTYMLCPLVPGVQEFHRQIVQRLVGVYDVDILKIDIASMDYSPPCYDKRHHHAYPEEPMEKYWSIAKIMYETGLSIKPGYVQLVCSCGLPHSPFTMPYYNMAHVSDPYSLVQARRRVKVHKALQGPRIAMQSRPVEGFAVSILEHVFASWVGLGLRVATSFVLEGHEGKQVPRYNKKSLMTAEKYPIYTKWFSLIRHLQLGMGEYINAYDIAYDFPEGHLLRKEDRMYYAFFTDSDANVPRASETWEGTLELRGLEASPYTVYDYEHKRNLGTVQGPVGKLQAAFKGHLLLECVPQ